MLHASVLTFQEFMTHESLPLTTIHEAILDFLRHRDDAVLFGAQAVNAYVPEPRMTQDIDILSVRAAELAQELREHLTTRFHIAVRMRDLGKGRGYRLYQIRNTGNRHLADILYVDKTRYVEQLEQRPEKSIILLRSRRFGKTLFCNMLGCYYDRNHADRFEELFSGTYIGAHPTPRRSSYMILSFNFSGINTETLENANQGFYRKVRSSIDLFLGLYHEVFPRNVCRDILAQPTPNDLLDALWKTLAKLELSTSVYVIIDEYDLFANNILSQGKTMFKDLVKTDGYVRPFYEALKIGTETVVDRIFITGVLPILLDSLTSGFNIGANLSTELAFNDMFGFTEDEITPILDNLGGQVSREEIRTYYDGYRFSPYADHTLYNSVYYGTKYDPAHNRSTTMIDTNVVSDYRKNRAVLSIGDRAVEEETLTRIVKREEIAVNDLTPLFILTQETEFLFDHRPA